jgi:hypothetical protein
MKPFYSGLFWGLAIFTGLTCSFGKAEYAIVFAVLAVGVAIMKTDSREN